MDQQSRPPHVVVEADGGSRGNPGPAAYGALLRDPATGTVIAERGEAIGVASNNVAEYRGLVAGLELAAEHAPEASVEVRMDSKLVVEQMSGRWKIKHPAMRDLAERARAIAPASTTYTWVPRAENKAADLLVNEALDGRPTVTGGGGHAAPVAAPPRGWGASAGVPTTLVLVRHGVSDHTARKVFSGGLGGANPPLNEEGRAQARATGDWLAPLGDTLDALVSSPVRRTRETADILADRLGLEVAEESGVAEMEFGAWDGLTFAEVGQRHPDELARWLGDLDHPAGGGESFRTVQGRVLEGRDRLLAAHPGRTVVVVSHVTPIKVLVADALGAPLEAVFRMELAPASVTVISYHAEADRMRGSLRLFNARPTDAPL
ncbi:MAG: bifunctional RNase H/acid phosphatase [Marmoricola sp.]